MAGKQSRTYIELIIRRKSRTQVIGAVYLHVYNIFEKEDLGAVYVGDLN